MRHKRSLELLAQEARQRHALPDLCVHLKDKSASIMRDEPPPTANPKPIHSTTHVIRIDQRPQVAPQVLPPVPERLVAQVRLHMVLPGQGPAGRAVPEVALVERYVRPQQVPVQAAEVPEALLNHHRSPPGGERWWSGVQSRRGEPTLPEAFQQDGSERRSLALGRRSNVSPCRFKRLFQTELGSTAISEHSPRSIEIDSTSINQRLPARDRNSTYVDSRPDRPERGWCER